MTKKAHGIITYDAKNLETTQMFNRCEIDKLYIYIHIYEYIYICTLVYYVRGNGLKYSYINIVESKQTECFKNYI